MNRIAAIFTSVYNTLKKVCKGVKNNYVSSADEGKVLWTYLTQFSACLFGIGILTFLFSFWTDHHEQVVFIDAENHGQYNDSCYMSLTLTTGESTDGRNQYGLDGKNEEIFGIIENRKTIRKRYSIADIIKTAEERNIEIIKDSIKQDSCAFMFSAKTYIGSKILNNGFFKNAVENTGIFYESDSKQEIFKNIAFISEDSIPRLTKLLKQYNKEIEFLEKKELNFIEDIDSFYVFGYKAGFSTARSYSWYRRGDLSTLNYTLYIDTKAIHLEKILFSFKTPTVLSNIYPEPDVLDLYKMEYTDSEKIAQVKRNGLSFEMEFVSGKSLQDFRMNVLIMVMSILITFALTIIFKVIILLLRSDHLGEDNMKLLVVYPVAALLMGIFAGKIANLIYVPWTRAVYSLFIAGTILGMLVLKISNTSKLKIKDNAIYYLWILIFFVIYYFLYIFIRIFLQMA